jgi:hypothetical protein
MMTYYAWFVVFAVVAYFIVTDDSVAAAFYYLTRLAKSNFERWKWWMMNNPRNPVVKYLIWRRALKLAKELEKEFKQ